LSSLIPLRMIHDETGNLTPIEGSDIPFPIKRVWFIHDVVGGARRGGHAHRELQEVIIAVSGSFDVVTVTENGRHRWHLNRATQGLYVPPSEWRHLQNFSSNSIALVLASTEYDPADYIHNFGAFLGTLPRPEEGYFDKRARDMELYLGTKG
jgi:hypothetical protein